MKIHLLILVASLILILPSIYADVIWTEDWTWTDNDWAPYDGDYSTWAEVETDRVDGNSSYEYPAGPGGPMESVMIKQYPNVGSYCHVQREITLDSDTPNCFRFLFYVNQTNKTVIGGVTHVTWGNYGIHFSVNQSKLYVWGELASPQEQRLNYSGTINPYTWYILYLNVTYYVADDWYCDDVKLQRFGSATIHQLNITTDNKWCMYYESNRFFIGTYYGGYQSDTNATMWSDLQLQRNFTIAGYSNETEYPELWGYDIPDLQPDTVISPTRIQLVEHEDNTSIFTDIWFDRDGFARPDIGLFIYSNYTSEGTGYAFVVFKRTWLDGKSYNLTVYYNLGDGNVTAGIYDGWYLRNSTTSFPDESPFVTKGNGKLQSITSVEGIDQYSNFKLTGTIDVSGGSQEYVTFFIFVKDLANDAPNNISIRRWMIYSGEHIYWRLYPNTTLFCAFPEGHRNGDYENGYGYTYYYDQGGVGGGSGTGDSYYIDPDLFDEPPGNGEEEETTMMSTVTDWLPLIMIMMLFGMMGSIGKKKKKKTSDITVTRRGNL